MKTIALCFSTPGMESGEWKNADYGKRYPGAGWMRHLNTLALKSGMQVIDGKSCIDLKFDPKEVLIVQEEQNQNGILLQKMGADPRVLMCLESPIYASHFYDQKDKLVPTFKHSLLFNGGTEHLYFPSFDSEDIRDPVPWRDREFLCMVTANKHYAGLNPELKNSPSFRAAMETQLQDYRYHAIGHFMNKPGFKLYGKGWGQIADPCDDKLSTIRNYKFALCFENGAYPGYITEKIIDCLVAGVVPVYMGTTDVSEYIPRNLYIDGRPFISFERLEEHLRDSSDFLITNADMFIGEARAKRGIEWLTIYDGSKYNNLNFAKRVMELCE
jgi:hypothetical protein